MTLILVATAVGLLIGLFGTPILIRLLRRHGYAQAIKDSEDFLYPAHDAKKGTPSMGGAIIVVGSIAGYLAAHLYTLQSPSASALCVLFLMTGLAAVGFVNDYIKIFKQRSTGLRARTKLIGQAAVSIAFAALVLHFPDDHGLTPASQAISLVRDTPIVLPVLLFFVWVYVMVAASSNGVNVTDGLDGLASGAAVMVLGAFVIIGVWQFRNACVTLEAPKCYMVRDPLDLAVAAAAMVGACSVSCGGTRRRHRSSWATQARWRWAARSPAWPSRHAPTCCCSCSVAFSSSSRCPSSCKSRRSASPVNACS